MRKICLLLSLLLSALCLITFTGCGENKENRTSYEIVCEFDGEKTLLGTEKVTFYNNTENSFKTLKFNLFANAYREGAKYSPVSVSHISRSYPNGINYGDIKITAVWEGEEAFSYEICGEDENILEVELKEEVFPGEKATINIDFCLTLANVVSRTGINDKTINLANFYPILCGIENGGFYECLYYSHGDPFFSDCSDYKLTFKYPEEYVVATSARVESSLNQDGKVSSTYTLKNARSFCIVMSTEFDMASKEQNGVTVNYYYHSDKDAVRSLNTAVLAIKTFSELFGDYPYSTFSVVETGFIEGGMEFPGLVMISDEVVGEAYQEVIVHETAHQWWQSVVGNNEIEYGFLDEGLTEYSVVLFYENNPEYNLTREQLVKSSEETFKIFCSVYDRLYKNVNTSMIRPLCDFSSEYEYVNIAYVKSVIMYDTLRKTVGDEKFFNALRRYYNEYSFKNADPYSIVGSFEKEGLHTNGYFETFYRGKEIL